MEVDLFVVRNATDKRIASISLRPKPGATLELAAGTERLLVVDYTRDAAALSSTPIATVLARGVSGDAADQARARSKVDDFARYLRERAKVAVLAAQRVGGSAIAGGPRVVLLASSTELLVAVVRRRQRRRCIRRRRRAHLLTELVRKSRDCGG